MDKLKPCPFCGGEAVKMTSSDGFTSVGCLECNPVFGVMVQAMTEAEAIEAWNTRAERTCKNEDDDCDAWFKCSECGLHSHLEIMSGGYDIPNYCPSCGAKVVE